VNKNFIGASTSQYQAYPKNYECYVKTAKELSEIGKKLASEGITLSYHNHYFEFEKFEGKVVLDILFEESEEKYLKAEVDTYWNSLEEAIQLNGLEN